jgi:hypothetical protein
VKLPSQLGKSNEMPPRSRPCVPDTQLAIFWTVRRSNPHLRDRLVRSDAGRRILTGDGEGALAGMRVGACTSSATA